MKKGIALTAIMLLSLPGCFMRRRKKKQKNRERKEYVMREGQEAVDVFSSVDIPLPTDRVDDSINVASDDVGSFFDGEMGEFLSKEDPVTTAASDEVVIVRDDAQENSLKELSWVEATEAVEAEFKAVHFDFDSDKVDDEQIKCVTENVRLVKEELKVAKKTGIVPTIVVEGHSCHSAGSPAYNLALSEKRAKKVADIFVDAEIANENIKIVGRGQEAPVLVEGKKITGSCDEQWQNRRVEVRVIYS